MKPLHLIALIIAFMLLAPLLYAKEHRKIWRLSAANDNFYREFGGRVFQVKCGRTLVYVKKKSDNRVGYFYCKTWRGSPNVWLVHRSKSQWKRIK